jgi:hypothetical protein
MGFYGQAAWLRLRKQAMHDAGWRCERCGCGLQGLGRRAHVHHRKRLKHAPSLGLEPLNLMALCRDCHSMVHGDERATVERGCDVLGNPTGKRHPWNAVPGGGSGNLAPLAPETSPQAREEFRAKNSVPIDAGMVGAGGPGIG